MKLMHSLVLEMFITMTLKEKIIEVYIWRNRKNDDLSFRIIKEYYKRLVRNHDNWVEMQ